jgi:drug/metabolite transporter (DMT)-like permease
MVVVQPILAMTVIFALPLGARLSGQRISSRDLIAAAVTTAGLAILLALGNPSAGRDGAPVEARVGLLYATIEGQLELPVLGRLLVPPPPPSEAGAA